MRQVTQNLKDGTIRVMNVPIPSAGPHSVLVEVERSLVSVGTERSTVSLGRSSMLEKARKRPDDVRRILDRARREGLLSTYRTVRDRLEKASPLGYSAAGTVRSVGDLVAGVKPGDRVACAGAGYANHAEYIAVPGNLCARIPDDVSFDAAAYTTLGAIAMQGLRQADVSVGDTVGIIGLGLVGLLTVQIAKAAGCLVVGFDVEPSHAKLAESLGADVAVARDTSGFRAHVERLSGGLGADAVVITASTESSEPVNLAADACRDRGVVVVVGAIGMELARAPFYRKELSLRLSRSYGPGRYDPSYEEYGVDYPEGFVKWTERRNMKEFLRLAAAKAIDTTQLTTHRFSVDDAPRAYDLILDPRGQDVVGVLLEYAGAQEAAQEGRQPRTPRQERDSVTIGLIGAGNFATGTLIPALTALPKVELRGIVTAQGLHAGDAVSRYGFTYAAEGVEELFEDDDTDAIVIATRHNTHAPLAIAALEAGKDVFVEKPLALSRGQLRDLIETYEGQGRARLMVGFNRRYSPACVAIRERIEASGAIPVIAIRVNAGPIRADHWIQRLEEGGGRIVGEMCHFVDLACFLAGGRPERVHAIGIGSGKAPALQDSVVCNIAFDTGAAACVTYCAEGDTSYPKELVEVFCGGSTLVVDDFRRLVMAGGGKIRRHQYPRAEKGHAEEMSAFVDLVSGRSDSGETFDQAVASTRATFAVVESLSTGSPVAVESGEDLGDAPED